MKASELARRVEALERNATVSDTAVSLAVDGVVHTFDRDNLLTEISKQLWGQENELANLVLRSTHSRGLGKMIELLRMVLPTAVETVVVVNGVLASMYLCGLLVG